MAKPAPARPAADPLIGRSILGCRLERRLGAGALSVVYAGIRQSDGMRVAVKMLTTIAAKDPENVQRFEREAQIGQRTRHVNIAGVLDYGFESGIHVLVMELIEGASMEAVIDHRGRLPWREAAHMLLQVGQAMAHLGSVGVIHRDIKPGNIQLTPGGIAKLVDLGFAKDGDEPEDEGLTLPGTTMGSPAYMPPEQVLDAQSAGPTADVYSLGATLFHAVTGKTPFSGRSNMEIISKVVREPAPDPRSLAPDLPPALADLIIWTMVKDPRHRPDSASLFVRELERAIAHPDDRSRIPALRRRQSGFWILMAVIAGSVVGLGALLFWLLHH